MSSRVDNFVRNFTHIINPEVSTYHTRCISPQTVQATSVATGRSYPPFGSGGRNSITNRASSSSHGRSPHKFLFKGSLRSSKKIQQLKITRAMRSPGPFFPRISSRCPRDHLLVVFCFLCHHRFVLLIVSLQKLIQLCNKLKEARRCFQFYRSVQSYYCTIVISM